MKTPPSGHNVEPRMPKGVRIAAAILVFAFLMGVRDEFTQVWIRVPLAGIAAAFLVVIVSLSQKRSD
ncbi:MAG TPA: hypothetical protein VF600_09655 [Abditibacteriaceae bacterium]|jgi:hypothetical protein